MQRIYHPYWLWEDYKAGFYDNCSGSEKEEKIKKVIELFSSSKLTLKYMTKVIDEWIYSCEHNLTNESLNKIAYIGQGACCIYANVPNIITMYAWKFLEPKIRKRSDDIANKIIRKWILKNRLKNTLIHGKKRDMKMGYQMKLLLNWNQEE